MAAEFVDDWQAEADSYKNEAPPPSNPWSIEIALRAQKDIEATVSVLKQRQKRKVAPPWSVPPAILCMALLGDRNGRTQTKPTLSDSRSRFRG